MIQQSAVAPQQAMVDKPAGAETTADKPANPQTQKPIDAPQDSQPKPGGMLKPQPLTPETVKKPSGAAASVANNSDANKKENIPVELNSHEFGEGQIKQTPLSETLASPH